MRYRLETERQSPLPEETHDDDDERSNTSASLGLGNGIVVQDNELPSRILTDEGDHDSDNVVFFSESYEGNLEGSIVALPPEPSNTLKDQQEGQSRNGTDSQSRSLISATSRP